MTTCYLSKMVSVWLLCAVATYSMAGNEAVPMRPNEMTDSQLVYTLSDPMQGDTAFSEIVERLERSGYDPNSSLSNLLAESWKATDEGVTTRFRSMCFQALCLVKNQEVVNILCHQLAEGAARRERVIAAHSLGQIGGGADAVVMALRSAVTQDKGVLGEGRSIAREAISALGLMGSSGTEALMSIWNSEDDRRDCEEAIITAMGQTKNKKFTSIMIDVLQGQQEALRDNAAWALGEIADDESLPILIKHNMDADANVREKVVEALNKIQTGAVDK